MLLAPCKCPKIACRFSNVPTTCPQQKLNQGSLSTWRWWFKSTSKILCRIQGQLWPENCWIEGFPLKFKFKPRQGIPNLPFPACLSILCGKYVWLNGTSQKCSKINIKRVQSQSWPEIANLTARCCSLSQAKASPAPPFPEWPFVFCLDVMFDYMEPLLKNPNIENFEACDYSQLKPKKRISTLPFWMHIQCQFYSPAGTLEHEVSTTEKWNGLISLKSIQVGDLTLEVYISKLNPKN